MKRYSHHIVPLGRIWEHSAIKISMDLQVRQGRSLLSTYVEDGVLIGIFQTWEKVRR